MIRERRGERRGTGRQTQRNVKGNQMWKKKKKRNMFTMQPFLKNLQEPDCICSDRGSRQVFSPLSS